MPWAVKRVVARRRNAAAVLARSLGRDWREHRPGVSVDRGVPVPVAGPLTALPILGAAATVDPPAAASADRPDLRDVEGDALTCALGLDPSDLAVVVASDVEFPEPADSSRRSHRRTVNAVT